jgi:hypothetical protein
VIAILSKTGKIGTSRFLYCWRRMYRGPEQERDTDLSYGMLSGSNPLTSVPASAPKAPWGIDPSKSRSLKDRERRLEKGFLSQKCNCG